MRLFIALELKDDIKDKISAYQSELKTKGVRGNFSRRENLHITLAFIGECGKETMKEIQSALSQLDESAFDIVFSGFDFFSGVLYLDVERNENFDSLALKVRKALDEKNIDYDRKKAKAHVTVLRKPEIPDGLNLKEYGRKIRFEAKNVNSVVLYESTRINGILQYIKKYEKRLTTDGKNGTL